MPRPKTYCPTCDELKSAIAKQCRKCSPRGGFYKRSSDHRLLMSRLKKGKPPRGFGWKHSYQTRKKMRAVWTFERRKAKHLWGLKMALDPEWRTGCGSCLEKNPRWEGGRSGLVYENGFSRKVRELVRERDKICQDCGSTKYLCVHHIYFEKKNHDLKRLVLLCRRCHTLRHLEYHRNSRQS